MDFEDSGIESDPKINTEKETLRQHNEPIISFSPERCRFDSAQSSSRKSSTSFPISVADLQLDEHPPSLANNNCNLINNLQNLSRTISDGAPNSKTTTIQQPSDHAVNQPVFTNVLGKQHSAQQQLKQAYPFLHNQQQPTPSSLATHSTSTSSSKALQGTATLVISTHTVSPTTSSATTTTANTKNRLPNTFLPTRNSIDSPSISLMVNGAVLSANNNNTTTTPTGTLAATSLDLQKRLEKRIAQASAIAAAASTSSSAAVANPSVAETKGNDSILSEIISSTGIANKPVIISPSASTSIATASTTTENSIGKNNGNQISFSPQNSHFFSPSIEDFQGKVMPSSSPTSLWESDPPSSAIDLWENKVTPGNALRRKESVADSFMDVSQTSQVHTSSSQQPTSSSMNDIIDSEKSGETKDATAQLDLAFTSAAPTTSCTTVNTSGDVATNTCTGGGSASSNNNINITSVNKSSSSKNNSNKPKGNQSLRNNNNSTTSNVPGGGAATSSSTSSSCVGGGSASTPGALSSSASVVTVVNASFDIRKVSALLPPQRLAIPSKSNPPFQSSQPANAAPSKTRRGSSSGSSSGALSSTNNPTSGAATVTFSSFGSNNTDTSNPPSASAYSSSTATVHKTSTTRHGSISETSCSGLIQPPSGNGNIIKMGSSNSSKLSTDSEKKPLVQWDSDESEEELSFFPPAKRGVITDNLSIDNMSLSGEEEDLHLTPPRPLAKKCPCDPRSWLDRTDISSSHHHHGDPTRSISSKFSCVIS